MATNTCKKRALQTKSENNIEQSPRFVFKGNDGFARFLVIKSMEEKAVTSLSPFIIKKHIESIIGTPKSVKKLKNKTLLVETCRKSQTESLLKVSTFFGLRVSVSEHQSLNSSKGIIRDRMLKGQKEEEIVDYLREQGVTACKRSKLKKSMKQLKQTRSSSHSTQSMYRSHSKFSIVLYRLTFLCQTLCAASTARGLAIMKTIAPSIWDLFVQTAVLEVTTTIPQPARTSRNV